MASTLIYREEGGSRFLWNIAKILPDTGKVVSVHAKEAYRERMGVLTSTLNFYLESIGGMSHCWNYCNILVWSFSFKLFLQSLNKFNLRSAIMCCWMQCRSEVCWMQWRFLWFPRRTVTKVVPEKITKLKKLQQLIEFTFICLSNLKSVKSRNTFLLDKTLILLPFGHCCP
jgi:hypothetical protein